MSRPRLAAGLAATALALLVGAPAAAAAASATAQPQTATVTSFDGTQIHVNFFTAAGLAPGHRAPTVLLGPGWSSPGDTSATDSTDVTTGIPGVGTLRNAGFNVVTWDPRGFGASGGTVEVDSPAYEGRDVSAIISWLAGRPAALLDRPGDPRVGMAGGSYGGGIQLVAAAIDPRIDAIVPDIAWNSLVTSLYKNQTVKAGWATELYLLGQAAGRLDPMIRNSYLTGAAGQPLTAQEVNFYASRGPGSLVSRIHVPTLLIQGTVDNLFTLQEAATNYGLLRAAGVPVQMLWFCGGHGICLTNPGDTGLIDRDTIAWLRRYLAREADIPTGPGFEWVDQDGAEHAAGAYPPPAAAPLQASGSGTLVIGEAGGSGPVTPPPGAGAIGLLAAPITPAKAPSAVNVTLPAPSRAHLVLGAPQLSLTYHGLATGQNGAVTRVYAQVVDDTSGKVLGNQVTPVPVTLDGATHTASLPLEILAATDAPGETFTLQLTASTVAYQPQRAAGAVTFTHIHIALPTVVPTSAGGPGAAPRARVCTRHVSIRLPRGTRSATAFAHGRAIARERGRRTLRLRLRGRRGTREAVRVLARLRSGHRRTLVRHYRLHC